MRCTLLSAVVLMCGLSAAAAEDPPVMPTPAAAAAPSARALPSAGGAAPRAAQSVPPDQTPVTDGAVAVLPGKGIPVPEVKVISAPPGKGPSAPIRKAKESVTAEPAPSLEISTPAATLGPQKNTGALVKTGSVVASGPGPGSAPSLASQLSVSSEEINARPVTRTGEVLEAAPGLIVTQHSGEGKANQYFLRGYNLDHGTDLAIAVDDMPINMRTHAHGQGYSDLNWLMPETVNSVEVRKGPYFADEGDFGSAGNLHISLLDGSEKNLASATFGSFGYMRAFAMETAKAGAGRLLAAGEVSTYDGPWTNPDDVRKLNGLMRYSQGTALNGFSLTAMAYTNKWRSTDQVPERAIASGEIGLYGSEDPSDGGNTSRFSLSGRIAKSDETGSWKGNAYIIKSELDLFNNFTYFLSNPTLGDQFHQHDDRVVAGGSLSRTLTGSLSGTRMETTLGVQTRYDSISLALSETFQRALLSNIRSDKVEEGSIGAYAEITIHWTDWLRTTSGIRADLFSVNVDSIYDANNSGQKQSALGSPKFSLVLGPFDKTEFFFGAGYGMHSNDARGVTITESPTDPTTKLGASPLLVRTRGAEVGLRTKVLAGLDSSLSLFILDQDSEIVFNGDGGDTSPSRPSERYGIEWTNKYKPNPWLTLDGELALSHARFLGYDRAQAGAFAALAGYPLAQIGNAPGNYIPNAPAMIASAGITLGEATGWFGSLRWRYLGVSPLAEDNAIRSSPTSLINGRVGYHFDNGWNLQLDGLNLLDTKNNQITYGYGSLIKSDNLFALCFPVQVAPAAVCRNGVMDRVLHPVEPLAVRLTVSKSF